MIPPNLRQDWLRNTGMLLTGFVMILAFLAWTLFSVVLGDGRTVDGSAEVVPLEFATTAPSAEVGSGFDLEMSSVTEPEEPARAEPAVGVERGDGAPSQPGGPIFPPQAAEPAGAFVEQRHEGLGAAFVMRADWRRAEVLLSEGDAPDRADIDLVFEAPDGGSRLALSAWDTGERAPFELWVMSVAGGMRSIDGRYPYNAAVGGAQALIVGEAETPTSPVRYAAFLDRGSHFVRIAWSGSGPSADPYDFARALVTLTWADALELGQAADTVPGLDLPSGIYYPSESLFIEP